MKLGVNIDHIATVREARKEGDPDLLAAVGEVVRAGADGITMHLREDRRHIQDRDLYAVKAAISVPLNLEMSLSEEIVSIAVRTKPEKTCLVPERRQEVTTEGGLKVAGDMKRVKDVVGRLKSAGIIVSLFIDPAKEEIEAAQKTGANFIELHTGAYARAFKKGKYEAEGELARLQKACELAHKLGLGVNAGHGLNYENVIAVTRLPHIEELNIGHSIIARALFVGIGQAVREMKALIVKSK